jgi:hypothetical protein
MLLQFHFGVFHPRKERECKASLSFGRLVLALIRAERALVLRLPKKTRTHIFLRTLKVAEMMRYMRVWI